MPVCIGGNSPVNRKVLATPLSLPQKSILEEHRRRTHAGVDHAEAAIEDAAVQNVVPPEPERGAQREIAPRGVPALRGEIGRAHFAVGNDLVEVMSQVAVGRVFQLVVQLALLTLGYFQSWMCRLASKPPVAFEQPHDPISSPMSAAQHLA